MANLFIFNWFYKSAHHRRDSAGAKTITPVNLAGSGGVGGGSGGGGVAPPLPPPASVQVTRALAKAQDNRRLSLQRKQTEEIEKFATEPLPPVAAAAAAAPSPTPPALPSDPGGK